MKAYVILDDTIMVRDHQGDLFEFRLDRGGPVLALRLVGLPSWTRAGVLPKNAETRIDVARYAARDIMREAKLIG